MTERAWLEAHAASLTAAIKATTSSRLKAAWKLDLDATLALLAEPSPSPVPAQPSGSLVTAVHSDRFVDSVGVNTHLHYPSYADAAKVKAALVELGVRHIRDYPTPANRGRFLDLGAAGIRLSAIMGVATAKQWFPITLDQLVAEVKALGPAVSQAEGPNEWDINSGTNWPAEVKTYMQQVIAKLTGVPVIGPSLTWPRDNARLLGDLGVPWNIHPYPGGVPPETSTAHPLSTEMSACWAIAAQPVQATEVGYHNQVPSDTGHPGASEADAGVYLPRNFLNNFAQGVVRSYSYELLDEGTNGAEARFGLVRLDGTRKPAFNSLRTLLAELSDPGAPFIPKPLPLTLVAPTDVRSILFGKRDGSYRIVLWRAAAANASTVSVQVNGVARQVGPSVQVLTL